MDSKKITITDGPGSHFTLANALFGEGQSISFKIEVNGYDAQYDNFYILSILWQGAGEITKSKRHNFILKAVCFKGLITENKDRRVNVLISYDPDTHKGSVEMTK